MFEAAVLALLSALPLSLAALRAGRRPPSWRALLAAPALFVALAAAGFALHRLHLSVWPYRPRNDDRGLLTLASLLAHGFGVTLPLVALAAAAWSVRTKAPARALALSLGSLAALGLSLDALVIEPSRLVERRYTVRSPRAPARGLTILHVSDLQTDGPCRRERLAVEAAGRQLPDFVLFTGDLTNGLGPHDNAEDRVRAANTFLRGLRARYAVLAVYGDWDAWGDDWPVWERRILEGTQAVMLYNRGETFELPDGRVTIYGGGGGGPNPVTVVPDLRGTDGLRVVMAHHPDALEEALVEGGHDLALVGHTHGGQVVLPFLGALVTHTRGPFFGGRYTVKGAPFIVSRGIGMRGGVAPRVRFNCPPEIGWIRVTR